MSITALKVSVLLSAMAVTACGTAKKSDAPAANSAKISDEEAKAELAKLPGVVIVKVPVDANGKEMNDKAEMRLVDSTQAPSQDNIQSTFDAAKVPAVTSELDKITSTESYCGWGFGGFGYGGWNYYRPLYMNYGYNYGYGYGGYYGYGYNNYYYYNRGFGYGYGYYY